MKNEDSKKLNQVDCSITENNAEAVKYEDLPKLTGKQEMFINRYFENGKNGIEAYTFAYDVSPDCKRTTIYREVWGLLKNPKIAQHIKYRQEKVNAVVLDKINYGVVQAFNALLTAQQMAFDEKKYMSYTYGVRERPNPNVAAYLKAEELKCKLLGLLADNNNEAPQSVASQFKIVVNDNS